MTTEIEARSRQISTDPYPNCHLCGATGDPLYTGLQDCVRGVAGSWDLKRCPEPGCGLVWLDPMPREAEIGKAYQAYYTHSAPTAQQPTPGRIGRLTNRLGAAYLQGRYGYQKAVGSPMLRWLYLPAVALFSVMPGWRDAIDASVCFLPAPRPGGRLLEVGFGNGGTLLWMRELGWDVVGIEADPVAVENSRMMGLDTRLGGLKAHAFPDASFDAIYASHVLEHVHDPLGLLEECRRILKPGGVVVMLTPNLAGWGHRRFRGDWALLDSPRHIMLFSPKNARTILQKAGFRTRRVRTSARAAFVYFAMTELNRRLGRLDGLSGGWPAWAMRRGYVQHVIENLLMTVNPLLGDELVLMAKK
jgi:SAM-dependent methyltransferase